MKVKQAHWNELFEQILNRISPRPKESPETKPPEWTDFPAYLLEKAKDEPLTDEVVSRFGEDFQNSRDVK